MMSQFPLDIRILMFVFGLYWGIRISLKEYQINRAKVNKKCFFLLVGCKMKLNT